MINDKSKKNKIEHNEEILREYRNLSIIPTSLTCTHTYIHMQTLTSTHAQGLWHTHIYIRPNAHAHMHALTLQTMLIGRNMNGNIKWIEGICRLLRFGNDIEMCFGLINFLF